MLGPNVTDKYSLAVTKIFGLRCNSQQCFASHFLIINLIVLHASGVFMRLYFYRKTTSFFLKLVMIKNLVSSLPWCIPGSSVLQLAKKSIKIEKDSL